MIGFKHRISIIGIMLVFTGVLIFLPIKARADVITGADYNIFFHHHEKECIHYYADCHTKTPVRGYDAPGDEEHVGITREDERLTVCAIWQDKERNWWGIVEIDWDKALWYPLSELYMYDESGEECSALELVKLAKEYGKSGDGRRRQRAAGDANSGGRIPVIVAGIVLTVVWILAVIIVVLLAKRKR